MALLRGAQKYEPRDRFIEPISRESVRHPNGKKISTTTSRHMCARAAVFVAPPISSAIPSVALIFSVLTHPVTRMAIFNVSPRSSLKTPRRGPRNEREEERVFFYRAIRAERFEFSQICRAAKSFTSFCDIIILLKFFSTLHKKRNRFNLFVFINLDNRDSTSRFFSIRRYDAVRFHSS